MLNPTEIVIESVCPASSKGVPLNLRGPRTAYPDIIVFVRASRWRISPIVMWRNDHAEPHHHGDVGRPRDFAREAHRDGWRYHVIGSILRFRSLCHDIGYVRGVCGATAMDIMSVTKTVTGSYIRWSHGRVLDPLTMSRDQSSLVAGASAKSA